MQPEIFEHLAQLHDYAEAHGLAYAWEGGYGHVRAAQATARA